MPLKKICFVGLENLPVLSRDYNKHGIGGEQVQHTLLARALAKRGFPVTMIVADYGQPPVLTVDGIRVIRSHTFTGGLPVLRFIHPRLTYLWSALRRADADVYYVSCASVHVGIVALFAQLHGRKLIFRIAHDSDCEPKNLIIRYWRDKKIYEYGLRRASTILAQTVKQEQALKANYGLSSKIATMLVEPMQNEISFADRSIDVLWVNNIRGFKRPDLMLELARRLPNVSFHMVGGPMPDSEKMYEEIQAAAKLIPNLTFHGRVPYHDVNDYYERTKVFVNTSDSEGFPNSYLQSWRRGAPTVAFFDPDSTIKRFNLGVAAGSMDEMVEAVTRLIGSPGVWKECSDRCKAYMDRDYGDDKVLVPYIEAIG